MALSALSVMNVRKCQGFYKKGKISVGNILVRKKSVILNFFRFLVVTLVVQLATYEFVRKNFKADIQGKNPGFSIF